MKKRVPSLEELPDFLEIQFLILSEGLKNVIAIKDERVDGFSVMRKLG
jgi:hypothetical protein